MKIKTCKCAIKAKVRTRTKEANSFQTKASKIMLAHRDLASWDLASPRSSITETRHHRDLARPWLSYWKCWELNSTSPKRLQVYITICPLYVLKRPPKMEVGGMKGEVKEEEDAKVCVLANLMSTWHKLELWKRRDLDWEDASVRSSCRAIS